MNSSIVSLFLLFSFLSVCLAQLNQSKFIFVDDSIKKLEIIFFQLLVEFVEAKVKMNVMKVSAKAQLNNVNQVKFAFDA